MSLFTAPLMTAAGVGSTSLLAPINKLLAILVNAALPLEIPGPGELFHAWRNGLLTSAETVNLMRFIGVPMSAALLRDPGTDVGRGVLMNQQERSWAASANLAASRPDIASLIAMFMRGQISFELFDSYSRKEGWYDGQARGMMETLLRNQIPQPGELVSFALRDVWKPAIVDRFQYDAEPSTEFGYWMEKLGFNGDARIKVDGRAQGPLVTWSQLFWRAHWANISPTQAYEMYQRLRPGRVARYRGELPNIREFTLQDLLQVLQINDYPVPFREQLAAIAYHKPRLVDIDRFFSIGSIDSQEAYELHLDLGYAPADARTRVTWMETEKAIRPRDPAVRAAAKATIQLYRMGFLDDDAAMTRLVSVYSAGALAAREDPQDTAAVRQQRQVLLRLAQQQIREADQAESVAQVKVLVRAFREQYLSGQIDADDARTRLIDAGMTERHASRLIARWTAVLASGRMMLSTAKVRSLVLDGVMPFQTAQHYLSNLGWQDPELTFLLTQLRRDLDLEAERAAERLARDQEQAEQAQIRQAQILNRERERTVRRLNRQASMAQLARYYERSIISESDYERELRRRGIDDENVKRHIFDARISRAERLARKRHVSDTLRQQDPNRLGAITPQTTPTPALPAPQGDAGNPFNPLG